MKGPTPRRLARLSNPVTRFKAAAFWLHPATSMKSRCVGPPRAAKVDWWPRATSKMPSMGPMGAIQRCQSRAKLLSAGRCPGGERSPGWCEPSSLPPTRAGSTAVRIEVQRTCARPQFLLFARTAARLSPDWFLVSGSESCDGRKLPVVTEAVTFSRPCRIPGWKGQAEDIRWRPRPPRPSSRDISQCRGAQKAAQSAAFCFRRRLCGLLLSTEKPASR